MTATRTPKEVLIAIQRFEFRRAEKLDTWQLYCLTAVSLLAVLSVAFPEGWLMQALAVATLLGMCISFFLLRESQKRRSLGETARRATLLIDGLGIRQSEAELRRLATSANLHPAELLEWADADYYAASSAPGPERMFQMLDESAFFSAELFRASASWLFWILMATGALMVLTFLLALNVVGAQHIPVTVSIFATLASCVALLELTARWLRYSGAAAEADEILLRLDAIRARGCPRDDLILALVDYNSTVEGAPLMFPGVFSRNRDRLNELYRRHSQHEAPPST